MYYIQDDGSIQKEMDKARDKMGGTLHPGKAVTTSGGRLPCKRIIHALGPEYDTLFFELLFLFLPFQSISAM